MQSTPARPDGYCSSEKKLYTPGGTVHRTDTTPGNCRCRVTTPRGGAPAAGRGGGLDVGVAGCGAWVWAGGPQGWNAGGWVDCGGCGGEEKEMRDKVKVAVRRDVDFAASPLSLST
ncbi:hypothetical protein Tco_1061494 [Tanacetum coccineum]